MFTICPLCTRQFLISAEQLTTSPDSQVRCGFCHETFNALQYLTDKLLSKEELFIELQSHQPVQTDKKDSSENVLGNEINIEQEPEVLSAETAVEFTDPDIEPELNQALPTDQFEVFEVAQELPKGSHNDLFYVEDKYLNQSDTTKRRKRSKILRAFNMFWSFGSVLGLLLIVLQVTWFNRDMVLTKYPQLTPYVKQLCKKLNCQLIRHRDPNAITLVNRDVRLHPRYQGMLLVNATIKNGLSVRQPFPKVQLTLFDTSGTLLAYRDFMPQDYLKNSIEIDGGMAAGSLVHFFLEVNNPSTDAVSFEFRFL